MKTKKSKRVMAVVMAVLLTVGIMPMDWAVTKAAASTVHSFDATAQASVGDDKAVIAEGTTFNDGYFKIVGKVTQRTNSDGSIKLTNWHLRRQVPCSLQRKALLP